MKVPKKYLILLGIVLASLIIKIIFASKNTFLWWDEAIYIGMSKYIFSGGALGFWEYFRPPVLPLLVGLGWWFGLNIIAWGHTLGVLASLALIPLTYFLSEHLRKNSGLWSALVVSSVAVFTKFSAMVLTGILATSFSFAGFIFLCRKKWIWAGFFFGLSFLTRFTHAVFFVAVGLALLADFFIKRKSFSVLWSKSWRLLFGFFIVLYPYLTYNFLSDGSILKPFLGAMKVIAEDTFSYDNGPGYYLLQILQQGPIVLFCIAGIIVYVLHRKYKDFVWNSIVISLFLLTTYFMFLTHKEVRFLIPILAIMSVLAGVGISWIRSISSHSIKRVGVIVLVLILCSSIILIIGNWSLIANKESYPAEQEKFLTFFSDENPGDEILLATTPLFVSYTDKPLVFLSGWEFALKLFDEFEEKSSHVAIDTCDYACEPSVCNPLKNEFIDSMNAFNKVFNSSYTRWDGTSCDVFIWKIK